jgi:hypothetical protein
MGVNRKPADNRYSTPAVFSARTIPSTLRTFHAQDLAELTHRARF